MDQWWAAWLGTTVARLHAGGVVAADSVDHVGVVEVAHGQGPLVYGPGRWVNPLRDSALSATTLNEGLDLVRRTFGRRVTQVLGPAWYGYADRAGLLDGILRAAANLGQWRSMPSLGVLTHPAYRGRGLGRQVVRAAAHRALIDAPHVQYRAWSTNAASIAVAERVGFAFYARAAVVDIAA